MGIKDAANWEQTKNSFWIESMMLLKITYNLAIIATLCACKGDPWIFVFLDWSRLHRSNHWKGQHPQCKWRTKVLCELITLSLFLCIMFSPHGLRFEWVPKYVCTYWLHFRIGPDKPWQLQHVSTLIPGRCPSFRRALSSLQVNSSQKLCWSRWSRVWRFRGLRLESSTLLHMMLVWRK